MTLKEKRSGGVCCVIVFKLVRKWALLAEEQSFPKFVFQWREVESPGSQAICNQSYGIVSNEVKYSIA